MSCQVFTSLPTRHPLSPLKARCAKVRIFEIIRIVSTLLPQLWAESTSLSACFAPMYVLVGDEVYGLIEHRHWKLVDRREFRKSPYFERGS
jgi:hypothetical protein